MGHVAGGIIVLLLVLWRLSIRRRRGVPDLPPNGNPVLDVIAKWTHSLLYLAMLLVPISGAAAWFGGAEAAGEAHGMFFNILLALVILHSFGAIYHQYIKKDGLMDRMKRAG